MLSVFILFSVKICSIFSRIRLTKFKYDKASIKTDMIFRFGFKNIVYRLNHSVNSTRRRRREELNKNKEHSMMKWKPNYCKNSINIRFVVNMKLSACELRPIKLNSATETKLQTHIRHCAYIKCTRANANTFRSVLIHLVTKNKRK